MIIGKEEKKTLAETIKENSPKKTVVEKAGFLGASP